MVFTTTAGYAPDKQGRLHTFCHALPDTWHQMGVMLSAAGSLQWYRDTLCPGVDFAELTAEAAKAPLGAEGLTFLPYLTGERTPLCDARARGGFIGLTRMHTRGHLTRAVLEGIDLDAVHSRGYAFQIETTYRALRRGFRVREIPIRFADRELGGSKMSRTIVLEAIWKVPLLRLAALGGRL